MKRNAVFPFCAVLGQELVKKALILNVVNPSIGGVLISGEKGTAKSTLVRGIAAILKGMEVVDLPLNVTEDRLVGTIDIEKAIQEGIKCFEPGILKKANGNILYVDEVNLLSDYIVNCLLEVSASHINHVEREGISCSHSSSFVLVGTMNPEEGTLRPQFLDRFGLYVEVRGSCQLSQRKEIIKRRLEYERKPIEYVGIWKTEAAELSDRISRAKQALGLVQVSDNILKLATDFSIEGNCAGHRAELTMIETAKAIAALAGRKHITIEDLKEAAELALPHRVRNLPPQLMDQSEQEPDAKSDEPENMNEDEQEEIDQNQDEQTEQTQDEEKQTSEEDGKAQESDIDSDALQDHESETENSEPWDAKAEIEEDDIQEPGEMFEIKPLNIEAADRKKRRGTGKRSRTNTSSSQGRYIRYTFPKGKLKDLAFDATLRAAAPFQKMRDSSGVAVTIAKSDFREKIREKRTGSTILFIVDASSSMGAKQRMKAVKGTILSILNDAYQKRDKVGMIAFRKDTAELMLGITRSVDLAQKSLREMPTGGKTPLASGLFRGYELIKAAKLKDPEMIPLIVLVSDGRTNVSFHGSNPVDDALGVAKLIALEGIRSLVIDTEKDFIKLGLAAKIAKAMNADYCKLEELEQQGIEQVIRSAAM